jgi:hypothetical protein
MWEFFHQSEIWATRDGRQILVKDLDKDHAQNILTFLEGSAREHKFELMLELISVVHGQYDDESYARKWVFGGPNEWDQHLTEAFKTEAVAYIKNTPICKAVERQAQ